ncbi:MAG TPA: hypothetical protein VGB45_12030 [Abditibacterium sp.]|jgi:hypothetical protein
MVIEDLNEMYALLSLICERKFDPLFDERFSDEMVGSPLIAAIANRLYDSIIEAERAKPDTRFRKDTAGKMEKLRFIEEGAPNVTILSAVRKHMRAEPAKKYLETATQEQKDTLVAVFASPYILSAQIIESLQDELAN